jgi:hypothetical protein
MAKIIANDLWFCDDCLIAACNGDFTGMDDDRAKEVQNALGQLKGYPAPDFDSETGEGIEEFSHWQCDCCGALPGRRHRFALLD